MDVLAFLRYVAVLKTHVLELMIYAVNELVSAHREAKDGLPSLLVHLFERICDVERTDLLIVLKFEELVPTVAGHIYKHVRPLVAQ